MCVYGGCLVICGGGEKEENFEADVKGFDLTDTAGRARFLLAESGRAGEELAGSGEDRAGEAGEFECGRRW